MGGVLTPNEIEVHIEARVAEIIAQKLQEKEVENATQSLRDLTLAKLNYEYPGSIVSPENSYNFELRPAFINLISQDQYGGGAYENPHAHIERFIRNCNIYRVKNVSTDTIRLSLFPFSLRDTAEEWLTSQPQGSITSWDDLAEKFTTRFFPRSLLRKMRNDIINFAQTEAENLYEAWERFKKLLRRCPQHNLSQADQVAGFYDGLLYYAKSTLDAAANGAFDDLCPQAGYDLIEKMAARAMDSNTNCQSRRSIIEEETYDKLMASNKQLSNQLAEMQRQIKEAKLIGARVAAAERVTWEINEPFSNTWDQGWRSHPNQKFQGQSSIPQQEQSGEKHLEELLESFINHSEKNFKNQEAAIKDLENQFFQLAKQVAERSPSKFPSNTINTSSISTKSDGDVDGVEKKVEERKKEKKLKNVGEPIKRKDYVPSKYDRIPFPQALVKKKIPDDPFSRITQMVERNPVNAKYILGQMEELIAVNEKMKLTKECSAIKERVIPRKREDPGKFTIPVEIEGLTKVEALCDLGSSDNVMPLSMFKRLDLGEVTPTNFALQMADKSRKTPYGLIEDVLVKVDKFVFPVDFVILDMKEDVKVPLILGRPFLATGEAEIKVAQGSLALKVEDEAIVFNMFDSKKHRVADDDFRYEVVDNG